MDYSVDLDNKIINCFCGSQIKLNYFSVHINSKKHLKSYNNLFQINF
jgi:hypothetical protein